jgi:hypothetical protein
MAWIFADIHNDEALAFCNSIVKGRAFLLDRSDVLVHASGWHRKR